MQKTLLLNSDWTPLRPISWTKAICLWLDDKVEILAEYAEKVYHAIDDWSGKMPAVVRFLKYVSLNKEKVKFSRRNVFARDNFTCSYCGGQPGTENLTYDHVLPRSQGGKTVWDNIVTACIDCNFKKRDRTPTQANMKLKKLPFKPTVRPSFTKLYADNPNTPEEWQSFLYWNVELQT